jgi:hypothetical protein
MFVRMFRSRALSLLLASLLILGGPFALAPAAIMPLDVLAPSSADDSDDQDDVALHAAAESGQTITRRHRQPRYTQVGLPIVTVPPLHLAPATTPPAPAAHSRAAINPPLHC